MKYSAAADTRVLVVDDNSDWVEDLSWFLSDCGFRVVGQAHSGQEAVEIAERTNPDVVIMDCYMEEGRRAGVDAIPAILNVSPSARVILFTAYSSPTACAAALSLGASAYLEKPMELDRLARAIFEVQQGRKCVDSEMLLRSSGTEVAQAYLTAMERHILMLLARDLDSNMIAAELGVGEENAAGQIRRLSAKLAKEEPEELVQFAKELARAKNV